MKPDFKFKFGRRKKLASLLGLTLDGSHLDGVVLKRTNGSLQLAQHFSVALTLDPLTAAPELVGREIRNLLDAAGVRERNCVFGVPLKWVLTAHTELPPLPEAEFRLLWGKGDKTLAVREFGRLVLDTPAEVPFRTRKAKAA